MGGINDFYARKKQSLVSYYFKTAVFYTKVKSTSEFKGQQFVVSTSYLKKVNGLNRKFAAITPAIKK